MLARICSSADAAFGEQPSRVLIEGVQRIISPRPNLRNTATHAAFRSSSHALCVASIILTTRAAPRARLFVQDAVARIAMSVHSAAHEPRPSYS